ncbi:MAG: hypothetical protein ACOY3P_01330 [Planctomycetota bacterium]
MRFFWIAFGLLVGLNCAPAFAERPETVASTLAVSPGEVSATPEMWFYEQSLQQYLDPKLAVRRKAEKVTAQRQARLAAMKWFGYSNSRPRAGCDPVHGDYSPGWSSNNYWYPFQWNGVSGYPVLVVPRGGSQN